jgi:NAD+ synthase (glutamine-hydrolysing)
VQEIAFGPSTWLWDYLRRSRLGGFFLALSGGADVRDSLVLVHQRRRSRTLSDCWLQSAAVAALVGVMCVRLAEAVRAGNAAVLRDLRAVLGDETYTPRDARELCSQLFLTCYMPSQHSSPETRERARLVAEQIGARHVEAPIDAAVEALLASAQTALVSQRPRFARHGGSDRENLALQNVQARIRMARSRSPFPLRLCERVTRRQVLGYVLAQLGPWSRGRRSSLLVLSSANVDEALRGYLTKYDCSSGDLNPIGAISKRDLRSFLLWAAREYGWSALEQIVRAPPTAELEPRDATYQQTDEADMGFTYDELSVLGRLRKIAICAPVSMFERLLALWPMMSPAEIADKVKRFFFYYSINRHKLTTLTPAYHAEAYSPDDNRYDLRPFLYNVRWSWQFRAIDARVASITQRRVTQPPRQQISEQHLPSQQQQQQESKPPAHQTAPTSKL